MRSVSEADNWTMVFATLSNEQVLIVSNLAVDSGYEAFPFEWYKPDLMGRSHAGGDRHPYCSEHIVVVYKRKSADAKGFGEHFALRKRSQQLQKEV
jgi:hypothetical protein